MPAGSLETQRCRLSPKDRKFKKQAAFWKQMSYICLLVLFSGPHFFPITWRGMISGKDGKNPFLRFQRMKGIFINEKLAMAPFPLTDLSTIHLLHSVWMYPQFTTGKRASRAFQLLQEVWARRETPSLRLQIWDTRSTRLTSTPPNTGMPERRL